MDVTIDPQNPIQQLIGIGIVGIIIQIFIIDASWGKWAVWGVGLAVWYYFNFIVKDKEGAVKDGN